MTPFRCKIGRKLRRYSYNRNNTASSATRQRDRIGRWLAFGWVGVMLLLASATDSLGQEPGGDNPFGDENPLGNENPFGTRSATLTTRLEARSKLLKPLACWPLPLRGFRRFSG